MTITLMAISQYLVGGQQALSVHLLQHPEMEISKKRSVRVVVHVTIIQAYVSALRDMLPAMAMEMKGRKETVDINTLTT